MRILRAVALAIAFPCLVPAPSGAGEARAQQQPQGGAVIRGVVVDTAGAPVAFATVRLLELHRGYQTHEDGRFAFTALPGGRYTLAVQRLGFALERRVIVVPPGGDSLRIVLSPSVKQLATSVVTGTVDERSAEEALSSTTVLGGAALDRRLEPTLAQTLQGQPGVTLSSLGPATSRPVVRGLSGDRVLVLEDGLRPGDLSSTSADHAVAVEALTARQVEVVRGANSLLYGSSALGGVVNVVREEVPTSRPDHAHGTLVLQGATVNRGGTVGATGTTALGHVAVRGEGSVRTASDLRTPVGVLGNTGLSTYSGSVGASLVGERGHVGAAYRLYANDYGIPGGFVGAHPTGVNVEMRRHMARIEGESHGLGFFRSLRGSLAFTDYTHAELSRAGRVATRFSQQLLAGEFVARRNAEGTFATGAVGVRAQLRTVDLAGALRTPDTDDWNVAGFVVQEIGAGRLRGQVGGRYDVARYTPQERAFVFVGTDSTLAAARTFGAFSGALGVLYEAIPGLRFGANLSRAYRTPDFNELYSDGPHLAAYSYDVGNPRLGEETGTGLDLFARFTRERIRAEVAVYRNEMRGYVFPRNTGLVGRQGDAPLFQYTGTDARFTGGEVSAEATISQFLVVEGSASVVRGERLGPLDSIPASRGFPGGVASRWLPFVPPPQGTLSIRWERPRWFAGGGVRAAARQWRTGDYETPTDRYRVFNVVAGIRLLEGARLHALTLRVDNLTDVIHRDHLSRVKDIMPEAGRNVSVLYRVTF